MTAKRVLLAFVLLIGLPYTCSPVYRFPEALPFSGTEFYNPYAGFVGAWKRANLHAHGTAWGGLTNGQQSSDEVAQTYRMLGYDIAGVSNYHAIAAQAGGETLPLYEHGYNISKRHQLAIGARRVEWFDFPFWQLLSQEQFIINRVGRTAELVGLTHPQTRDAYSDGDLQHLTGYQLIEVVNGPFESSEPWDTALSSGRAVWAMANDDTHDTGDPKRTAMAWNMIDTASTSPADVVTALRAGRTVAVGRRDDAPTGMDVQLTDVRFADATLHVTVDGARSDIEFIGQHGKSRGTFEDVLSASFTFARDDTYIRTVIHTPRTTLYLNPVLRYDGRALPAPAATVDALRTWSLRIAAVAGLLVLVTRLWPRRREAQSSASSLPDTNRETA